jgi:hypothetical protein
VEYLFADMGSITNTFPNAGVTNGPINLNVNTVRAGINYKFNCGPWWFDGAAMRRPSPLVKSLAAARRLGSFSK